jgi:hypothetical protein
LQSTLAPTSSSTHGFPWNWAWGRQRRTVHAGQRAQHHLGRGHGRAGVARGHKAGRLALAHQLQPHAHGAVFLGPHRVRRLLLHADAFRGMVDDDGQIFVFEMFVQKVAQLRLRPNQVDPHRQSAAGENRPANLRLWSFVGTYGVKRDVDEHGRSWLLGCFLDVQNGAALVRAALGAGAMGQLLLVAVGALGDSHGGQKVVERRVRCGASSGASSD